MGVPLSAGVGAGEKFVSAVAARYARSRDERRRAYQRFHDAFVEYVAQVRSGHLVLKEEMGLALDQKKPYADALSQAALELAKAAHEVRIVGNPGPQKAAGDLLDVAILISKNAAADRRKELTQGEPASYGLAMDSFTEAYTRDLGYQPQWWQIWRADLWNRKRCKTTAATYLPTQKTVDLIQAATTWSEEVFIVVGQGGALEVPGSMAVESQATTILRRPVLPPPGGMSASALLSLLSSTRDLPAATGRLAQQAGTGHPKALTVGPQGTASQSGLSRTGPLYVGKAEGSRNYRYLSRRKSSFEHYPSDAVKSALPLFTGLYISLGDGSDHPSYLRFFASGRVLGVTSSCSKFQVMRWLRFDSGNAEGDYSLYGPRIRISTRNSYGDVDYSGAISLDSRELQLQPGSHENDDKSSSIWTFHDIWFM